MRSKDYLLLGLIAPVVTAQAVVRGAVPVSTAFTYQGQLKRSGVPWNGTCSFAFSLWNDATSTDPDDQIGTTLTFDGVTESPVPPYDPLSPIQVTNGLFTVQLDFGAGAFDGNSRWLEVAVCCAGPDDPPDHCAAPPANFAMLDPRQELTPVPYALHAATGGGTDRHSLDAADGDPVDALVVDSDGKVGIGMPAPQEKLHVGGRARVDGVKFPDGSVQTTAPPWTESGQDIHFTPGNVGIGTPDPQAKLHIGGAPGVDGIRFPDGSVQTTAPPWTGPGNDVFYTAGSVGIGTSGLSIYSGDTLEIKSAALPSARKALACVPDFVSGRIYCFGGYDRGPVDEIVEHSPGSDTLITKDAKFDSGRSGLACAADPTSRKIYCFGGQTATGLTDQIVEYDPRTDTLVTMPTPLPSERYGLACAAHPPSEKIYCLGGYGPNYLNEIVEYDPRSDTLVIKSATLPWPPRRLLACTAHHASGKIYCFGGEHAGHPDEIDEIVEYDPGIPDVEGPIPIMEARLPSAREGLACAVDPASEKIYCLGGYGPNYLNEIVEYDPGTDGIVPTSATLASARAGLACVADHASRKIYCFGGYGAGYLDEIVEYDPPFQTLLQVGEPGDGTGAIANTWSVFSSRSFKRDIEPLSPAEYHDILAKLQATDVVRYRYIRDVRQAPHLGVIAEDSPTEILSPGGKAVSLADYAAFLLAAIKAQQAELTEKDWQIDDISSELAETQGRLTALEALVAKLNRSWEEDAR